jgi:hypothetical protein
MSSTSFGRAALHLALLAATAWVLTACASPQPTKRYVPLTNTMQPLGELHLSNAEMRLSSLEGTMKLKYVGHMSEEAGEELAGALVYRVRNADKFFKRNAGHAAYCAQVPQWVAVNSKNGAPAWSAEIWVGLLTIKDWAQFTPAVSQACADGQYLLTPE